MSILEYLRDANFFSRLDKINVITYRGIRTVAKFRSLTKIVLIVMHLVNLCKKNYQKMQIGGSSQRPISILPKKC